LERAQGLIPAIRGRAVQVDANRQVAQETIDELLAADLLQMLAPRRFGGPQAITPSLGKAPVTSWKR
jgi:hypothetical protein